jgi:DNA repair ATPase RecN
MINKVADPAETIVSFAPNGKSSLADGADPFDTAGQNILGMLQRAANMAEETSKQALDVAQKLSLQLQSAERRIKDLEADVRHYQDQANRAKDWLTQIAGAIEQRFFGTDDKSRASNLSQRPAPRAFARNNNVGSQGG